jgi:hypothetical protein
MNRMFERLRLQEHFSQIYADFGADAADDMIRHAYEHVQARREAKRLQQALEHKNRCVSDTIEADPF